MFFIVPECKAEPTPCSPPSEDHPPSPRPAKRRRLCSDPDETSGYYPKRTPKACDRCRLKKARCQWSAEKICDKCQRDGVICTTMRESKREVKAPNAAYVQLVESQRDCLLQAVAKILEGGLSNDQTAMAKVLRDSGIRAEALNKASKQRPEAPFVAEPDGTDRYQNAVEVEALLGYCDLKTAADDIAEQPSKVAPTTITQPTSYFDLPLCDSFKPDYALPNSSAEPLPSLTSMFSPSIDLSEWLVPNSDGSSLFVSTADLLVG